MGKFKVYKEQEPIQQKASESFVAYSKIGPIKPKEEYE